MEENIKTKNNKCKTVVLCISIFVLISIGITCIHLIAQQYSRNLFRGAIAANGKECAEIGRSIFHKHGNVIDVTIAVLFCEGISMPQSTGLGGGFILVFYNRTTKQIYTLNARERAPLNSNKTMFQGSEKLSSRGPLAIAVPGELMGYWKLHKRFGSLPWSDLVQPSIELAKNGHFVTPLLERILKSKKNDIYVNLGMREAFIDPSTNDTWLHGQYLKRPVLAETLEVISKEGANALYNGSLTKKFVEELQTLGSIITEEDLNTFQVEWQDPILTTFRDNHTLYTSNLPSSGSILVFILNILDSFLNFNEINTVFNWNRIIESFKFAYGIRTLVGDVKTSDINETINMISSKDYIKSVRNQISAMKETANDPKIYNADFIDFEDSGTAHISVIAPNGDAVSVTGTINLYFGSMIRSRTTGIILNDEMDDFSVPNVTNQFGLKPSAANLVEPGKRPLSSMCPAIIVDKNGDVKLVIGGAGGSKITSALTLGIIRYLWFNNSIQEAVSSKRLHHQLYPMEIQVENGFDQDIIDELVKLNHSIHYDAPSDGFAAILGLSNRTGKIDGALDPRRSGSLVI